MRSDLGPALQAEVSPAWATGPRKPRAFRSPREELHLSWFFPLLSFQYFQKRRGHTAPGYPAWRMHVKYVAMTESDTKDFNTLFYTYWDSSVPSVHLDYVSCKQGIYTLTCTH